ncbi:MAG: T9SS type A sorting domain-containing protein [Bacteroidetes bacterium]|nr:T9SS type A sorting domain-containing protein [Bacteroidota bacterium]
MEHPPEQQTAHISQLLIFVRMSRPLLVFRFALVVLLSTLSCSVTAQLAGWKVHSGGGFLKFPWTGGLDACQFAAIDLNADGVDDLVVFDRRGNRWLCFVNDGIPGQISYRWAPEFVRFFPKASDWVVFADYDGDGRPDLFTYSPGWAGIRVFRNTGKLYPQFTPVVEPFLSSLQGGGYVNIISTNADQPGIADLDGDGDLDLLTFWALGTFVEQHTNRSRELYGHSDSLIFEKTSFCWGRIAESEESNTIFLDTCLFRSARNGHRHRGATMLLHDFTGNGLPDLLLGDVDYPGLNLLTNGGTQQSALIVAQDTAFPSYDVPVRLYSMPGAYLIDVNNDGLKDLIVSPFDPNYNVTENYSSVWLYLNEGSENQPVFRLHTKRFLQDQTIDLGSGAYPVFVDLNGDGLLDIVAGNIGRYLRSWFNGNTLHAAYESSIHVFTQQPSDEGLQFELTERDLARLSLLGRRGLVPAFADISGNGLPDMLVGSETGGLIYVAQQSPGSWSAPLLNFGGIQTPAWSAPAIFDLDEDRIQDLMIGSRNGKIIFLKGSKLGDSLVFQYVTNDLGGVDVTDYSLSYDGFSVPQGFYAPDGRPMLVVGSEQGRIWLFDQIRNNLNGVFSPSDDWHSILDTIVAAVSSGYRSAAYIGRLDGGQKLQMVTGNFSGGLELWNARANVLPGKGEHTKEPLLLWPNPASGLVRFRLADPTDCKILLQLTDVSGRTLVRRNMNVQSGLGSLDVSGLKQGIYLITIYLPSGKVQSSRLVISR